LILPGKSKTMPLGKRGGATSKPKLAVEERDGPLRTPEEAAAYLAVKESLVRRLFSEGKLRGRYISRQLRFHVDDLDAFIEESLATEAKRASMRASTPQPLRRRSSRRRDV
jgi:excisionase family DNA binding protein